MNLTAARRDAASSDPLVSVVIIGRNEGARLVRCIESVGAMRQDGFRVEILYVDSASTDGSPESAAALGAQVIVVHPERPSAALGRNAGWRAARGDYVLFLDGDTELHPRFVERALEAMRDRQVAVVWGHRRESRPEASIYNRVLDLDWIYPPGRSDFCGGDALMRRDVLAQVGGFDAALIAGEEPELCRRIRARGHAILHLDVPMTRHDLAIRHFAAYWKRAYRAGHAYAEIASRFAGSADPLWQKESRRNLVHGGLLLGLLAALPAGLLWPPVLAAIIGIAATLVLRTYSRCAWKATDPVTRLLYSLHSHFQQVPILVGQASFRLHSALGRNLRLIDYKAS